MDASVQRQKMACTSCQHEWTTTILLGVVTKVFTAHIRSLRCPKCSAGHQNINFVASTNPVNNLST